MNLVAILKNCDLAKSPARISSALYAGVSNTGSQNEHSHRLSFAEQDASVAVVSLSWRVALRFSRSQIVSLWRLRKLYEVV